jgi:hypothetical protein
MSNTARKTDAGNGLQPAIPSTPTRHTTPNLVGWFCDEHGDVCSIGTAVVRGLCQRHFDPPR